MASNIRKDSHTSATRRKLIFGGTTVLGAMALIGNRVFAGNTSRTFQAKAQTRSATTNSNTSQISSPLGSLKPNHVAISVPNLEEAVRWYQEKLNFRLMKITEIPEISAQRVWLELNGFVMEIFVRPKSTRFQPPLRVIEDGMLAQGYFHIAFTVDDLDAVAAELHKRGVKFFFEPKTFNSDKRKVCFIKDNNGNPIELVQLLG